MNVLGVHFHSWGNDRISKETVGIRVLDDFYSHKSGIICLNTKTIIRNTLPFSMTRNNAIYDLVGRSTTTCFPSVFQ